MKCVLCDRESMSSQRFTMTPEAQRFSQEQFPGVDLGKPLSENGVCQDCLNLSEPERQKLAEQAIKRILAEAAEIGRSELAGRGPGMAGSKSPRIDVAKTIETINFPDEVWEWLDLFGEVLGITQRQFMLLDGFFLADTPYKQLLVRAIQRDISSLNAIYLLLRCEWIHQAAAHARLFCESLITLRYLARDKDSRVPQFLDYAYVENYRVAQSMLEQERGRAKPVHVQRLEAILPNLESEYGRVKARYSSKDRSGRERLFRSWCNVPIDQQAQECGDRLVRLYRVVYSQLSAYVHGSAWSLGRQIAYSRQHYDPAVVLIDISTVVRTTLVVWEEWARFCDEQLGLTLVAELPQIAAKMDDLESRHFPFGEQGYGCEESQAAAPSPADRFAGATLPAASPGLRLRTVRSRGRGNA
jgi:hypothetical protein